MRGPSIFLRWVPGMLSPYCNPATHLMYPSKWNHQPVGKFPQEIFSWRWSRHLAAALLSFLVLERTSFMVRSFETCAGCMERTRTIAQYETWKKIWPDRWMPLIIRQKKTPAAYGLIIGLPAASFVFMHLPCELASLVSTEKTPAWPKMYKTTGTKNLTTNLVTYNHIYTWHNLQKMY